MTYSTTRFLELAFKITSHYVYPGIVSFFTETYCFVATGYITLIVDMLLMINGPYKFTPYL